MTRSGHPLLGLIPELRRDPIAALEGLARQGDVVRFRIGPLPAFTVNDPEAAHHVLVRHRDRYIKSPLFDRLKILLGEGLVMTTRDEWRWDRRQLQPAFTRKYIDGRLDEMVATVEDWMKPWQAGEERDLAAEMLGLSLGLLVGSLMPQVDRRSLAEIRVAFEAAQDELATRLWDLVAWPLFIPTIRNRRFREARASLLAELDRALTKSVGGTDLVATIVGAEPFPGQRRTRAEKVHDQLLTFLFAGHETTSNSLAFLLHHLAREPEVCADVRAELREVLGDDRLTLAHLSALPRTRAAIEEALRVHPTIWAFTRHAVAEDRIAGVRIPRGSTLLVSPWTLHRHPKHWREPERYDPTRFEGSKPPRGAFIPFGAGPRACIGDHFAMLEMTAVLSVLLRRFDWHLPDDYVLRPRARLTVGLDGGLPATLASL